MQQSWWSATEHELYAIFISLWKVHYMIEGGRVLIRTDHKPLIEIVSGSAKIYNLAAMEKFHHWTAEILEIKPVIKYKKGSTNLIADSSSRLRRGQHKYNELLDNKEPIHLEEKSEVNKVQTHAKTVEQENVAPKLPELQIKV